MTTLLGWPSARLPRCRFAVSAPRRDRGAVVPLLLLSVCSGALSGCSGDAGGPAATTPSTANQSVANQSVAIGAASLAQRDPRRLSVELFRVPRQALTAETEFTGNLLPARGTPIMAEVEGIAQSFGDFGPFIEGEVAGQRYAVKLGLQPGQQVAEGALLAQLDPTSFELDVAAAEAQLTRARAEHARLLAGQRSEAIARIKAAYDEARARSKLAVAVYERAQMLSRQSAASLGEVERAEMEWSAAQAMVATQQAMLNEAEAGPTAEEIAVSEALIRQAEAELKKAQHRLQKTSIYAPYDGVLSEINVYKGQQVSPATRPLFEILDLRYLAAEVGVPESYIGKIKFRDNAQVQIAGANQPVPGLVIAINDKVDAESRNFTIRVGIDNAARRFKAGQFATVRLQLGDQDAVPVVPDAAIKFTEGEPGVFVYRDGRVRRVGVALGIGDGELTEIKAGLSAGELVVVDDPTLLIDGMAVEVRNPELVDDPRHRNDG